MDHSFLISLGLVFSSSLAGSFHCGAMCGSFSCLASKGNNGCKIKTNQAAYHSGRFVTYLLLTGVFYSSSSLLGTLTNSNALKTFIALSCILLLFADLFKEMPFLNDNRGLIFPKVKNSTLSILLEWITKVLSKTMKIQQANNQATNNFLLGLSTGLIPCGWLYIYISLAGTQDSLIKAMILITSFWLGTLPILIIIGIFGSKLSNELFPKIKYVSRALLICAALISINLRAPFLTITEDLDCSFCFGNLPKSAPKAND